jgi:hypothetical protein
MESKNKPTIDEHIQERYAKSIRYYWKSSQSNKRWYKLTRSLTVIIGALVTLIAALTSSSIFPDSSKIGAIFAIATPVLAAVLTIIAGFAQSFQWGSAWQNMVLTAEQMQKEYDKYIVTPENQRDYPGEAVKLNNFVINESKGFFEKMLGNSLPSNSGDENS